MDRDRARATPQRESGRRDVESHPAVRPFGGLPRGRPWRFSAAFSRRRAFFEVFPAARCSAQAAFDASLTVPSSKCWPPLAAAPATRFSTLALMSFVALSWCFRRTVFWRRRRSFGASSGASSWGSAFFGFWRGGPGPSWRAMAAHVALQCWSLSTRQLASSAMRARRCALVRCRRAVRAMLLSLPVQCQCRARRRCNLLLLALL